MNRILPLVFAGFLMSLIGVGCDERQVKSRVETQKLEQEQQPMNLGQTGSEHQTQEQKPMGKK